MTSIKEVFPSNHLKTTRCFLIVSRMVSTHYRPTSCSKIKKLSYSCQCLYLQTNTRSCHNNMKFRAQFKIEIAIGNTFATNIPPIALVEFASLKVLSPIFLQSKPTTHLNYIIYILHG